MNYTFPVIQTIDDVLPAIEGRKEFIVAEREHYDVVNYVVAMPDTFAMDGPDDLMGAIRRECRGLIFDKSGKIISRPVHKFFNLGERDETQPHVVDFSKQHSALIKEDGSMLRPIMVGGYVRWATKMGLSDVAAQAEYLCTQNDPKYDAFATYCIENDLTPVFEWVSPDNKIVLQYEKHNMILLAVRELYTGNYVNLHA